MIVLQNGQFPPPPQIGLPPEHKKIGHITDRKPCGEGPIKRLPIDQIGRAVLVVW